MFWFANNSSTDTPRSLSRKVCPLRHRQQRKVCHTCAFWKPIDVRDAATGVISQHWDCAHIMGVFVQRDTGQATFEMGSALESFRNEMVKLIAATIGLFAKDKKPGVEFMVACRGPNCTDTHAKPNMVPLSQCACHREQTQKLAGEMIAGLTIRETIDESIRSEERRVGVR